MGHRNGGPKPIPVELRLWSRVDTSGDCWIWQGAKQRGYGQINLGQPRKLMLTHRLAWQLTNGPIPNGMDVLHRCDNPPCCRPDHLFLGTALDNARDMIQKYGHPAHRGRSYMPKGKDHHAYHHGPKLTRLQAEEIRRSTLNQTELAKKYGVSQSMINHILAGRTWR